MEHPVLDYEPKSINEKIPLWRWGFISILFGFLAGFAGSDGNDQWMIALFFVAFALSLVGVGLILVSIFWAIFTGREATM